MNNLDTLMRVGFVEEKGEGGGGLKTIVVSYRKQKNQIKSKTLCVFLSLL